MAKRPLCSGLSSCQQQVFMHSAVVAVAVCRYGWALIVGSCSRGSLQVALSLLVGFELSLTTVEMIF